MCCQCWLVFSMYFYLYAMTCCLSASSSSSFDGMMQRSWLMFVCSCATVIDWLCLFSFFEHIRVLEQQEKPIHLCQSTDGLWFSLYVFFVYRMIFILSFVLGISRSLHITSSFLLFALEMTHRRSFEILFCCYYHQQAKSKQMNAFRKLFLYLTSST